MPNRSRHAKKIDVVHWTFGVFGAFGLADAASVAVRVLTAQHLPETLLRIRGEWSAVLDGIQAGPVAGRMTMGLILVPEGTDTTVLWDPEVDGDAPWIVWDVFNLQYEEMVTDVIQAGGAGRHRVIDSKAMRKVRNTELQAVFHNSAVQGASGINASGSVRVLSGS